MGPLLHNFFAPVSPHTHRAEFFGKLAFGVVFVLACLALLQAAPRRARKGIIAGFTFLGGLYYTLEFFLPAAKSGPQIGQNSLTPYQDIVTNVSTVVAAFAVGIGVISLMQFHTRAIARRRAGWGNSVALIVSFLAMLVFGLLGQYAPTQRLLLGQTNKTVFTFLFKGGLNSLDSTTFALIAFFIASASYRAFRLRSLESTTVMVAALIVMLGATFGTAITGGIHPYLDSAHTVENPWANLRLERVSSWLLTQINAPAQRGILFGLYVGSLAVSLRLWLSLERGAYFDKEI